MKCGWQKEGQLRVEKRKNVRVRKSIIVSIQAGIASDGLRRRATYLEFEICERALPDAVQSMTVGDWPEPVRMTLLKRELPVMETLQFCEDASSTAGNVMLRVFCEAIAESAHDCRVEHEDAWAATASSR